MILKKNKRSVSELNCAPTSSITNRSTYSGDVTNAFQSADFKAYACSAKSDKLGKLFDAVKVKKAALDNIVTAHLSDSNNI